MSSIFFNNYYRPPIMSSIFFSNYLPTALCHQYSLTTTPPLFWDRGPFIGSRPRIFYFFKEIVLFSAQNSCLYLSKGKDMIVSLSRILQIPFFRGGVNAAYDFLPVCFEGVSSLKQIAQIKNIIK